MRADDFQVRHLGQIGQNFVLHAVSEKCIFLVGAQVFERQHGNRLVRRGSHGKRSRRSERGSGTHQPSAGGGGGEEHHQHQGGERREHPQPRERTGAFPVRHRRCRGSRAAALRLAAPAESLEQFVRGLWAFGGIVREHARQKRGDWRGNARGVELGHGERFGKLAGAHLGQRRAGKRQLAGERVPERRAQRIDVRTRVRPVVVVGELLGAGKLRRAQEVPDVGQRSRVGGGFGEPEIDHFDPRVPGGTAAAGVAGEAAGAGGHEHQVGRLEVAVDEFLLPGGDEGAGDFRGNGQHHADGQRSAPADGGFERFALDEFHRVERLPIRRFAEMENAGDIRVPQPGSGAGFAQETLPDRGIAGEPLGLDDLERDVAVQAGVERLVGDPHGSASEFPHGTIFAREHGVMFQLQRRSAGDNNRGGLSRWRRTRRWGERQR